MSNKNILIVGEHFSIGGFETYVLSHCEVLKKEGFNVYLVTSKDSDTTLINDLISETLYIDGFPSTSGKKIKEIYFMLKKFIEKNSINYIQIHPHVSAIISAVVAIDLNIPYSYTAHGPLNFSPVYGIVYKTLLFEKVLPNADKIYAVSEELKKVMLNTNSNLSITVLPNILTTFDVKGDSTKKYISIISRLDKDKLYGVLESIKFCKTLIEIEKYKHLSVKIIGDGECFEQVEEYIEGNNKFELVGYSDNVLEYINNSFFVCGMGRVVLESMSLNKPILLVGYDGLKDFVTTENVDELALVNFSGRNKNTTVYEDILNQLSSIYDEKYQLKNWVYKNRSFEILIKEYRQLKDTILLKPMYKDKEWSKLFLEISNQLLEEDILSPHNLIYFIELFNFNRETKIIMSLFEEYNKAREDKNLIELELGMVKQSHLEISHKNIDLDNKYKEILKILSSISQRELDLLYKTISDLELESESYKSEILKTNEIINFKNSEIHNLSTKLNNNELIFGELSQKTLELYNSKYFKLVNLIKRLNVHFIKGNIQNKKEFVKWISKKIRKQHYVSYNKMDHPLDQLLRIIEKKDFNKDNSELNELPNNDSISEFQKMYKQKYDYFNQYLQQPNNEYVIKLKNIINNREYKGIVVYPQAVHWEPMQRPQHFLREFSKKGYLCFFCTPSEGEFSVQEYEENLFIVNDEAALLSTIRNKMPIVLCTWMGQKAFIDHLQNKILWYDLLDQLEFFADTDQKTIEAHYSVLDNADIVSYSAEMLHKYVQSRKDAILLSNASNLNDFISSKDHNILKVKIPNKMNRKVVGYFGAVEEWFDASLINELAANNKDLLFVIIGHVSQNVNLAKEDNILLLGKIEYSKLVNYASQFDVAIIPFLVNDLTNCVSPVKYFEYRALNLPVVTTPIHEMKRYQNQYGMYLAETVTQFEQSIRDSLNIDREKLKAESQGFVLENQWLNRVELVEQMITNNIQNLKALANYNTDKHISVMTGTFLGLNGEQFYSGGAERYLIDLFEVAKKMNHELIIYQYGTYPWTRKFKNIEVRSLARGENRMEELSVENIHKYNSNFYEEENGVALLNIYSAFFEAWPRVANPSIGISHGIAWDSTFNEGLTAISFWEQNRRIIEAATIVNKMVSVDTNTTNWFQTIDFETGNKMEYIPNYVDTNIFKPIIKQEERIVISYPRRLYGARGLYLVLEILDEILETYPEVDFHFIGKGFEEDTKHVERKIKKWKSRVKWYSLDPSEMHKAYEITDISLVPTLHSEGTSLSCLEAMASGNAVISTRIGGLTDLIINNFNGLLIEPNSKDLLSAIKKLLDNPELMSSIRRNAVEVSKVFSMNQWKEKWTQIIESFVDKSNVEYKKANRTIHIYVKDSNDLKRFIQKIHEYLNNGDLVMIFMENMISKREKHSFGRLQFMTFEEDIFDPGEYVIVSNELQEKFSKNIIEIHEVI